MSLAKLSTSQLAEITGQDRKTVAKYLGEAGLECQIGLKGSKDYPAAAALRILLAISSVGTSEDVAQKQAEAKLRTTLAQADKAELDLAIRRNEYLPTDAIVSQVEYQYTVVRARLTSIPNALARQLALEESPATINDILTKSIDAALADLSIDSLEVPNDTPVFNAAPEASTSSSTSLEAVAETDSSGMG